MKRVIVVHDTFTHAWPFVADRIKDIWDGQGDAELIRVSEEDRRRVGKVVPAPDKVVRLISLGVPVTLECLGSSTSLKEIGLERNVSDELKRYAEQAGIRLYCHTSKNYFGQSVAECGLALTLCGLRRIPQLHREIIQSHGHGTTDSEPARTVARERGSSATTGFLSTERSRVKESGLSG